VREARPLNHALLPSPFSSGRENTVWVLTLASIPLVRGGWDGGGVTERVLVVYYTVEVSCL
jgi:hypothetical protein